MVQLRRHQSIAPLGSAVAIAATLLAPRISLAEPEHAASEESAVPWLWLGLGAAQDVAVASGENLCTKDSQLNSGFVCFRQRGSQYHGTPVQGAKLERTAALATTRLFLIADVATESPVSLGARLGYSVRGGPRPDGGNAFIPYYVEARSTLWFADRPYPTATYPAGFAFLSAGLAQLDARYSLRIDEDLGAPPPASQIDNPPSQDLDVWKKTGPWFGAAGIGTLLPTGASSGVLFDVKAMLLFPEVGTALAGSLGFAVGL